MPVIHSFQPESLVKACKAERMVSIESLSEARKQILWLGIKTLDPPLADLLRLDQALQVKV